MWLPAAGGELDSTEERLSSLSTHCPESGETLKSWNSSSSTCSPQSAFFQRAYHPPCCMYCSSTHLCITLNTCFSLVSDRWHAEEALCCLSLCRWLQGCHSGRAYSWGGSLFSQRHMGTASEVSARHVVVFSTLNKCVVEGKRKSIWFITVLKIAMFLCKFIVACTKEWTKTMQDKDAQTSHLSPPICVRIHQQNLLLGYEGGQIKSENRLWCSEMSYFCSMQPAL